MTCRNDALGLLTRSILEPSQMSSPTRPQGSRHKGVSIRANADRTSSIGPCPKSISGSASVGRPSVSRTDLPPAAAHTEPSSGSGTKHSDRTSSAVRFFWLTLHVAVLKSIAQRQRRAYIGFANKHCDVCTITRCIQERTATATATQLSRTCSLTQTGHISDTAHVTILLTF